MLYCVYSSFASSSIIFTFPLCTPYQTLSLSLAKCSSLVHRAPSYLLVLHSSIAVPPTHLYSAPLGVRLYQVAAHAPFVASLSSFVFGVVHCTVLATSRCNIGFQDCMYTVVLYFHTDFCNVHTVRHTLIYLGVLFSCPPNVKENLGWVLLGGIPSH